MARPKLPGEPKPKPAVQPAQIPQAAPPQNFQTPVQPSPIPAAPNFRPQPPAFNPPVVPVAGHEPPPTALPEAFRQSAAVEDYEESTRVQKRNRELYKIEIWRGGVRQNVIPVHQKEIVIGRGSKSKPVDVPLSGDPEISRRHLVIYTDGNGHFSMVNEGRNPAIINNYELPLGQQISIAPGVPIAICTYVLRIQM